MSGFVYIWRDRKHSRHYIGSHWGSPDDGYICSSRWMKSAYKRRPHDFKRRILKIITTSRTDLIEEEDRWLKMIKPSEKTKQYYNLYLGAQKLWSLDKTCNIGQKISRSKRAKALTRLNNTGSRLTEAQKKIKYGSWNVGRVDTKEVRERKSKMMKQKWANGEIKRAWKGHTEEHKAHLSAIKKGRRLSDATMAAQIKKCSKTWQVTPPNGEPFIITNLKEYARNNGLYDCAMKKTCGHKGYKAVILAA